MGGVWAIFMTLGIIVAQRLLPIAVATASGSSSAHPPLGPDLAAERQAGVAARGLPEVFSSRPRSPSPPSSACP
jgi:SET family sugar efflux transporter-like MFS transporter